MRKPEHEHQHNSEKNIKTAFFLNLGFAIIEIGGGLFTNSLAIISDALHDCGDSVSLGISWYLEKISKKNRTDSFSYGYKRFSLLGALISSFILLIGSLYIITNAIPRIIDPQEVNTLGMLGLSILGIIINGLAVLRLKGAHKLNEKIVMFHFIEDVLGWIAVLIGSIMIMLFRIYIIDSILSILIALFIIWKTVSNLLKTLKIFLQAVPLDLKTKQIAKKIKRMHKNIIDVHDVHIWSLDGHYNILTIHLVVKNNTKRSEIVNIKKICRNLFEDINIHHATIEIETEKEKCELMQC